MHYAQVADGKIHCELRMGELARTFGHVLLRGRESFDHPRHIRLIALLDAFIPFAVGL